VPASNRAAWLATLALFVVPAARAEPNGDAPAGAEPQRAGTASLVLVGEGTQAELGALLFELLGRQGVTAELSRVERFDRALLFDAPAEGDRVDVFIVLGKGGARLYFRGPGGERFLLRKLALPNGLDAVGKEAIGQVVESSTLALLRSSEAGVDRAQASAEVERDAKDDAALAAAASTPVEPVAAAPAPTATSPATPAPKHAASYAFEVLARYSLLYAGPDIGVLHGPGIALGFTRRTNFQLSLRALVERRFDRDIHADGFTAGMAVTSLRGSAGIGLVFGGIHTVALSLGAGVDFVAVSPEPSSDPTLTLAEAGTHHVPLLRPEIGYELTLGALALAAGAFADVSLYDTHYDVAENGTVTRAAEPWAVRPGAGVSVGGRW